MWVGQLVFIGAVTLSPGDSIPLGERVSVHMPYAVERPPAPFKAKVRACEIVGMVMHSNGSMNFDCELLHYMPQNTESIKF